MIVDKILELAKQHDYLDVVQDINIVEKDQKVTAIISLLTKDAGKGQKLQRIIENEIKDVRVILTNQDVKEKKIDKSLRAKQHIPGVGNIIAVASGKGGVGKSTIAASLALSLAKKNYKIALVDADIYGPSISKIFAIDRKIEVVDNYLEPIEKEGIKIISMGNLLEEGKAAVWRGPMITKILYQLLLKTSWRDIDIMVIDLPPGTGDIHLSLLENFIINSAILVTTPQELSLSDVYRAADMFNKLSIPILGLVENMSYFESDGKQHYIFGKEGGAKMTKELGIPLLAQVPILANISAKELVKGKVHDWEFFINAVENHFKSTS